MKTIRLVYPQWQGGHFPENGFISKEWFPGIPVQDLAQGYMLGAQFLAMLAPPATCETFTVPISTEYDRKAADGVMDRDIIALQTKAALDILNIANADRIAVLGGECSVSAAPFTWLAHKYQGDIAMVWIDAHPDITLPGEAYDGYHAMACTACLGMGDPAIIGQLPARIEPQKTLFVGLRDWERDDIKNRQKSLGIDHLTPEDLRTRPGALKAWLDACPARHILVHFDLDVLDPAEIIPAVGKVPDGMKTAEAVSTIQTIATAKNLVGLTVAEPMPQVALKLRRMLAQLPLLS